MGVQLPYLEDRRGAQQYVLKAVPGDHGGRFEVGLRMASTVAESGIPTGAPRSTVDGGLVVREGDWCWALLDYLGGHRVDVNDPEQLHRVGRPLGRVHRELRNVPPPDHVMVWGQMDWLLAEAEFLEPYPWIQRAIAEAFDDLPDGLVTGMVHGDPRVTEFRIDGGTVGLLDWGEVMYAPHVFDVATILSYLDPETDSGPLLHGYLTESVVAAEELAHVNVMRKFRYAAEAWIYAMRNGLGITLGQDGTEHTNMSILEQKQKNIAAIDSGDKNLKIP